MKRILSISAFALLVSIMGYAHNHSLILTQGESLVGYNMYNTGSIFNSIALPQGSGTVDSLVVTFGADETRTNWGGDSLSFEYALFDGFSIGAKTNAVQLLVGGIRDNIWIAQGALYSSLYLNQLFGKDPRPSAFRAFWNFELQPGPVYQSEPGHSDGIVNVFSTLSGNLRLVNTKPLVLSSYLDLKTITYFIHPFYKAGWMKAEQYMPLLQGLHQEPSKDFSLTLLPAVKFVAAAGLEVFAFNHFQLFAGLNMPIGMILYGTNKSPYFEKSRLAIGDLLSPTYIEIELRCKL